MASMFLRVSLPGTDSLTGGPLAVPGMGTQLQHLANFGVLPEADVAISEEFSNGQFGDGQAFELRRFHFQIENSRPADSGHGAHLAPGGSARLWPGSARSD